MRSRNAVSRSLAAACAAAFLGVSSCAPPVDRNAAAFEAAGEYESAAEVFMAGLRKKPSKVAWTLGLKKNAQLALEAKAAAAAEACRSGDYAHAQQLYEEAFAYKERVEAFRVTLALAPEHRQLAQEAQDATARRLYDRATTLMSTGDYGDAEGVLAELRQLKPNGYRDVEELWQESVYQQAMAAFDREEWRGAHAHLSRLNTYRDAPTLVAECLDNGRIAVALLPVGGSVSALAEQLYASTLDRLTSGTDPFVTYVDRRRVQAVLSERRTAGFSDPSVAVELGRHMQAKYLVALDITAMEEPAPFETRSTVAAWSWDGSTEEYTADSGKTRKRAVPSSVSKTEYTVVNGKKSVHLRVHLQITETATSAIVASRELEHSRSTSIEFALYSGNLDQLYSTKPGKQQKSLLGKKYYASKVDHDQFRAERQRYPAVEPLWRQCVEAMAAEASDAVASFVSAGD